MSSVGLLAVAAAVWLSTQVGAQAQWTELRGEGFVLRSPIAPGKLADVACDLERAVRTVQRPNGDAASPTIVAVDNARAIREWLPQFHEGKATNPLGAYWRGLYGHHIVVRVDTGRGERFRRILHEYTHYATHLVHPEPPRWFDEGLSELWEHAAITPGSIEVGRPVPAHLKRLRSGKDWIPMQELLSANDLPTQSSAAAAMFYAQSWALMHYLIAEKANREVVPNPIPAAADLPTDDQLKAYVRGPMPGRRSFSTGVPAGSGCKGPRVTRTMTHLETVIGRAQALADSDRPDAALPLLGEALRLDPGNVDALELVGFVHFTGNRPVEAAATFDGLIAEGRASHIAYYYRAVLATPVPGRTGGGGPIPQVEYLRKALALSPGFAPAAERLKELSGKGLPLALGPGL